MMMRNKEDKGGLKMLVELLEKTRRLNAVLQMTDKEAVSFSDLCGILSSLLDSNVYVISKKGKVLGLKLLIKSDSPIIIDPETGTEKFPKEYNDELLRVNETKVNITGEESLKIFKYDYNTMDKYLTIIPIYGNGQRQGTLIVARYDMEYGVEDVILGEYGATIVGIEILRAKTLEFEEEARKKAVVQMAIGTLSYSELEAIQNIFAELEGNEGLLVASKIADRVGITRSVIVNALRKFESAGVIESRSLGMKGTHIRILNDKLMDELARLEI